MSDSVSRWVHATVRDHARGALVVACGYLLVAVAALGMWFFVIYGLMFMFALVLTAIGVGVNVYVVFAVWLIQLVLYPLVRRPQAGEWEVATDVDGGVYVVAPERVSTGDHAFTHRGVFAGLFFAVPIALEEAWREFRRWRRFARVETEPLARMASVLLDHQRKVTLAELQREMSSDQLARALIGARSLPGFQLFAGEPQGVALTDGAIREFPAN
jgi:hypothetical protein